MEQPLISAQVIPMNPLRPVLDPDNLVQILEEAHQRTPLRGLRVVCKNFDSIIARIVYRQVCLTERIVSCFEQGVQDSVQLQIRNDVCKFSQHVCVNRELDWPVVKRLLDSLESLKELRWCPWDFDNNPHSILDTIFASPEFKARWPDLRLSIGAQEGLEDEPGSDTEPSQSLSKAKYLRPLVSLHLTAILLSSPNLEDLYLSCGLNGPFSVNWHSTNKRLPPVKKLVLRGIEWDLSPSNIVTYLDWSRITHLELYVVPIVKFLRTVTPEHLSNLRTFMTDSWTSYHRPNEDEKDQLLCNLVNHIQALEKLVMRCTVDAVTTKYMEAVTKHGSTLRSLEIRPLLTLVTGLCAGTISIKKLIALNSACPELRELGLDVKMNIYAKAPAILTTTIAAFRKLRCLAVYAYRGVDDEKQVFNEDRAIASAWIEDLVALKQGVQLEKVVVKLEIFLFLGGSWETTLTYTHDFRGAVEWHCSGWCIEDPYPFVRH